MHQYYKACARWLVLTLLLPNRVLRSYCVVAVLLILLLTWARPAGAQVGIGTNTPDPSAVLDLSATDQGLLAPRLSSTQMTNITSPAEGLVIYNTDFNALYYFSSGSWQPVNSTTTGISTLSPVVGTGTAGNEVTLQAGTANDQVLKWDNGTMNWVLGADDNTQYSAGTGLVLSSTTFSANNSSAIWNADRLLGAVISSAPSNAGEGLVYDGSQLNFKTIDDDPADDLVSAKNGLSVNGQTAELGGLLSKNTLITHGNFNIGHKMNGTGGYFFTNNAADTSLAVLPGGNIGMGTGSPQTQLALTRPSGDVRLGIDAAAGSSALSIFGQNGSPHWALGRSATNRFQIADVNPTVSPRFTIDQQGNVGIGQTNPIATLEVNGDILLSNTPNPGGVRSLEITNSSGSDPGDSLYIAAGSGGAQGGGLILQGGQPTTGNPVTGGSVLVRGGDAPLDGLAPQIFGGEVRIVGGEADPAPTFSEGGDVFIYGGKGDGQDGDLLLGYTGSAQQGKVSIGGVPAGAGTDLTVRGNTEMLDDLPGRALEVVNESTTGGPSFNSGRTGIGTKTYENSTTGTVFGFQSIAEGLGTTNAIYGEATGSASLKRGVWGSVRDGGNQSYAIYGVAQGSANTNYGVYGAANTSGGTTNYGVYGTASGATTNYAGYFDGDVIVDGGFAIGVSARMNNIVTAMPPSPLNNQLITAKGVDDAIVAAQLWDENSGDVFRTSGNVGIGTNSPSHNLDIQANQLRGINVRQQYSGGGGAKTGIFTEVTSSGSTSRIGVEALVADNATDNQQALGYASNIISDGSANKYGYRSSFSGSGSGDRWGFYGTGEDYNYFEGRVGIGTNNNPSVMLEVQHAGTSTLNSVRVSNTTDHSSTSKYGINTFVGGSAGSGVRRGYRAQVDDNSSGNPTTIGYDFFMNSIGSGDKYGMRGSIGTGPGNSWGVYVSQEDFNYFSGNVGIGNTDQPGYPLVVDQRATRSIYVNNNYNGANAKHGVYTHVDGAGSGPRYGYYTETRANAANNPDAYAFYTDVYTYGTGNKYGLYVTEGNTSGAGGSFYGIYTDQTQYEYLNGLVGIGNGNTTPNAQLDVSATTEHGADFYNSYSGPNEKNGIWSVANSAGSGNRYGVYARAEDNSTDNQFTVGVGSFVAQNGTGNKYAFYAQRSGAATNGDFWGIRTNNEDFNSFSGNVGIGVLRPLTHLNVLDDDPILMVQDRQQASTSAESWLYLAESGASPGAIGYSWQIGFQGNDLSFRYQGSNSLVSGTEMMYMNSDGDLYLTQSDRGLILSNSTWIRSNGSNNIIIGHLGGTGVNDIMPKTDDVTDLGNSGQRYDFIYATTGTVNTSDSTQKQAIGDLNYGLAQVMALHPVEYEWKKKPYRGKQLGLLAQEVQQVLPEVVVDSEWERDPESGRMVEKPNQILGMQYHKLVPVLIKGMQEQQAQIEALQAQVKALQARMDQQRGTAAE